MADNANVSAYCGFCGCSKHNDLRSVSSQMGGGIASCSCEKLKCQWCIDKELEIQSALDNIFAPLNPEVKQT